MNAAQLMTDLARLGIRIEAHGDRLRYSPRSAVTPDLAQRMKTHKGELLEILQAGTVDDDEIFTEAPEALDSDGWPLDSVDPNELTPCTKCGTLEQWQSLTGTWGCVRCEPPAKARRLREWVEKVKLDRSDSPVLGAKAAR